MFKFELSSGYPFIFLLVDSKDKYVNMINVTTKKNNDTEKINKKTALSFDKFYYS